MNEHTLALAVMDDDGYGCVITSMPFWFERDAQDERHARSLGKTSPADRWIGHAELRAVDTAMRARGERPWNGCTHHYLTERYGARLFHVMNGGWFVRPETALPGGGGSSLLTPRPAGPDQRDRARTSLAGHSQATEQKAGA